MKDEATQQHRWLERMVGEWASESECVMGPDQPVVRMEGTEVVRPFGGLWVVAEGTGDTPDGEPMRSIMTLGFDARGDCFVGTFIASMMAHLWVYRGTLDEAGKVLTLESEGPGFTPGKMELYRDIIEFESADHRIMRSQARGEAGEWHQFMTSHYRRKA